MTLIALHLTYYTMWIIIALWIVALIFLSFKLSCSSCNTQAINPQQPKITPAKTTVFTKWWSNLKAPKKRKTPKTDKLNENRAQIELQILAGWTNEDIAKYYWVGSSTVQRWKVARGIKRLSKRQIEKGKEMLGERYDVKKFRKQAKEAGLMQTWQM